MHAIVPQRPTARGSFFAAGSGPAGTSRHRGTTEYADVLTPCRIAPASSAPPSLRRNGGGVIVNIASTTGHAGTPMYAPYVASKWALRGLTKTAALELGRDGIRVNSIHPGVISTPLINDPIADRPPIADFYSPAPFAVPRMGEPSDITSLLLHVTSADASFITGSEFVVDGGLLLGPALQPDPDAACAGGPVLAKILAEGDG